MSYQIVPLTAALNQTLTVTLQVDGASLTLNLSLQWQIMSAQWVMNIYDGANNPLVLNLPLLAGAYPAGNMLQQYVYLQIGSVYLLQTGAGANESETGSPVADNLTTDFVLVWGDTPTL